ncbi:unnamed protein product [Phaeothamnion confervicola]
MPPPFSLAPPAKPGAFRTTGCSSLRVNSLVFPAPPPRQNTSFASSSPSPRRAPKEETTLFKAAKLIFCFVGLQASYLTWGYLQEIIMTIRYDGEKFPSSTFIVFTNRCLALLVALVLAYGPFIQRTGPRNHAPMLQFSPCSISNVISSWAQYECLKYISMPMQVVSKSCKVIPVMLVGKFVHRKSYPWIEYFEAVAITVGVSMFSLSETGSKDEDERSTELFGLLLVGLYLTCDSFTSQWQDHIFKTYKIDQYQMMFGVNCFSILFTLSSLILSGSLGVCFNFLMRHPESLRHIGILSVTSATGQLFIFYTIKSFGPIVFTIIMTCRQMLSMVISCIVFGHQLGGMAVLGAIAVFGTVGYRIHRKLSGKGGGGGSN